MRTNKAQISTAKKIIIMLVVVLVLTLGFARLYGRARADVEKEFDPDKFYSQDNEEGDIISSGMTSLLPTEAQKGAKEIAQLLFYTAFDQGHETLSNGQLLLLTELHEDHSFFRSQTRPIIGMKFVSGPEGILVYLVRKSGDLEQQSLFLSPESAPYLRGKKLCYLPDDAHAPLIADISGYEGVDSKGFFGTIFSRTAVTSFSSTSLSISNLGEFYQVKELSMYLKDGGSLADTDTIDKANGYDFPLPYTPYLLSASFVQNGLSPEKDFAFIVPSIGVYYNAGTLVWIQGDTLCLIPRTFEKNEGLVVFENSNQLTSLLKGSGRLSDNLVKQLKSSGLVKEI